MGAACLNEDAPLAPQLEDKKTLFKAAVGGEGEGDAQAALLVMLELWCVKERRAGLEEFGPALKVLWERDIVGEEQIEAWHQNERALQEFMPSYFEQADAEAIRESSREFVEWMQAGEYES
eukprot:gnl/TRDRNA2_/TRDRNA2_39205_c0_seq1.p1 gnl/TRDRNA2_/TRDRNA2_39205_c0~~gnl/TRDRNA2_/TRDRNA2_39205_c0_seq1.p1  ORF type:complete len:121 (+),score=38.45 gnl/TRDRNA2_/TRDRNA2_39205_c0_seq1:345-707(+)